MGLLEIEDPPWAFFLGSFRDIISSMGLLQARWVYGSYRGRRPTKGLLQDLLWVFQRKKSIHRSFRDIRPCVAPFGWVFWKQKVHGFPTYRRRSMGLLKIDGLLWVFQKQKVLHGSSIDEDLSLVFWRQMSFHGSPGDGRSSMVLLEMEGTSEMECLSRNERPIMRQKTFHRFSRNKRTSIFERYKTSHVSSIGGMF